MGGYYPPGGIGGTAQRIYRVEDLETEKKLPMALAVSGAVAAEVGIAFLMLAAALLGPATFYLAGAAVGLAMAWWVRRRGGWWVEALAWLMLWAGAGLVFGPFLWKSVSAPLAEVGALISLLAGPVASLPFWAWCAIAGVLVSSFVLRKPYRILARAGLMAFAVLWTWRNLPSWFDPAFRLARLFESARWVLVPFCLPPVAFAGAVVCRNWIESLIGSVWPPQYRQVELGEVGIAGMLFPRAVLNPRPRPGPEPLEVVIRREDGRQPTRQTVDIPRPKAHARGLDEWALDVLRGVASVSVAGGREGRPRGATAYGYTQREAADLVRTLVRAGLAKPRGDGQKPPTAEGIEWMESLVAATFGDAAVPGREEGHV